MARIGAEGHAPRTEHVAQFTGTLHSYALASSGEGYRVTFIVPLTDAPSVIALNAVLQRGLTLTVARRRRRSRGASAETRDGVVGDTGTPTPEGDGLSPESQASIAQAGITALFPVVDE